MNIPIVLVHGICGFGKLSVAGFDIADYFRGIPAGLRNAGFNVPEPPELPATGSIAERAEVLKQYLNGPLFESGQKVCLLAHSMGGLDCRYLISRLGMAERVQSLTTLGTPHQGSPIADSSAPAMSAITDLLGVDLKGFADLTIEACAKFNEATPDHPDVRYYSVAGHFSPPNLLGYSLGVLGPTHDVIAESEGDNDGLVSIKSATYGQYLGAWPGNHFDLINWGEVLTRFSSPSNVDVLGKYLSVLKTVA